MRFKGWNKKVAMGTVAGAVVGALVVLPATSFADASTEVPSAPASMTAMQSAGSPATAQKGRAARMRLIRDLAKALHTSPKELRLLLQSGKTLKQIATQKGVSMQSVEAVVKASVDRSANTRIDKWFAQHWNQPWHGKQAAGGALNAPNSTT